jgi:hypothetical protein
LKTDRSLTRGFQEVSAAAGIDLLGKGRGSAWADLDGDGLEDFGVGLQEASGSIAISGGSASPR